MAIAGAAHLPRLRHNRSTMDAPPVQYVRTSDGFDIAYTICGSGPPVILLPEFHNNVQLKWRLQRYQSFYTFLAERFELVMYDERGMGMSSRGLRDNHTMEDCLIDLESVVERTGGGRFALIAINQSIHTAIPYASLHPDRVFALVIAAGPTVKTAMGNASSMLELASGSWEAYLTMIAGFAGPKTYTNLDGMSIIEHFRRGVLQQDCVRQWRAANASDISESLSLVRSPTLIAATHAFEREAKTVAAAIPGARLSLFDGAHPTVHVYSDGDEAPPARLPIADFISEQALYSPQRESAPGLGVIPEPLSLRELEVLRLLAAGQTNQQIADALVISINTVRRHVSNVFDKTGVANRAQAGAWARDHGLA